MSTSLSTAIRANLARCLDGPWSLRAFDEWFVPATIDVERSGDAMAEALTWEIYLRLAEYSNGDCTEDELKGLLRQLVEPVAASVLRPASP